MVRPCLDPDARRVALSLLARGLGSPGEIADLAGVSRQVVEGWALIADMDWRQIKRARLAKAWRKEWDRVRP